MPRRLHPLALPLVLWGVLLASAGAALAEPVAIDHGAWLPAPTPGAGGLRREDAAGAYDPVSDRVWLHGGYNSAACLTGDLWELTVGDAVPVWRPVVPQGAGPSPRSRHTMTYDPVRNRLIVYGGLIGCGSGLAADVWALSLGDTPQWTELTPSGEAPRPRERQTAVYDPVRDRIVYFGGYTGDPFTDETWALNLTDTSWERLTPPGTTPSARWFHTAIYDPVRDRMLVFGGDLRDANVYALNFGPSPTWSIVEIKSIGLTRMNHGALYDPVRDRMVVVAGVGGSGNDVWALSLSGTPMWSLLEVTSTPPPARYNHVTVYDPVRDRVIVHGGNNSLADTWSLALADLQWTALLVPFPQGPLTWTAYDRTRNRLLVAQEGPSSLIDQDRVFAYDLSGGHPWTEVLPAGPAPPTRHGVSAIYDPVRDRVILYGGSGAGEDFAASSEVWSLWLGSAPFWQRSAATGAPPGRRAHAAVYDARRDRMLVVGGLGGYVESGSCSGSPLYQPVWRPDTWAWSLGDSSWSYVAPADSGYGHLAVVDSSHDRILAFGGVVEQRFCRGPGQGSGTSYTASSAVRQLALNGGATWTPIAVAGPPPAARYDASGIYDPARTRMVLFGGQERTNDGAPVTYFDDTWALDFSSSPTWVPLMPAGMPPAARAGAGAIYEAGRSKMWLQGGEGAIGGYFDLWTLTWDRATAILMEVVFAEVTSAGVHIIWRVESDEPYEASVERTHDGSMWTEAARLAPDARGQLVFEDASVQPGERVGYRLRLDRQGEPSFSPPQWLQIPTTPAFRLQPAWPNPSRGDLAVELGVPSAARVRIAVYDVLGRRVLTSELTGLEAGTHRITLAPRARLSPGVYLIEASLGSRVLRTRAVLLD